MATSSHQGIGIGPHLGIKAIKLHYHRVPSHHSTTEISKENLPLTNPLQASFPYQCTRHYFCLANIIYLTAQFQSTDVQYCMSLSCYCTIYYNITNFVMHVSDLDCHMWCAHLFCKPSFYTCKNYIFVGLVDPAVNDYLLLHQVIF